MYKEGVSLNFSDGYIDPEEMMQDGSYPPTYPNNEPLLDPDDSYQQKDQLLRIVFNIRKFLINIRVTSTLIVVILSNLKTNRRLDE